MECAEIVLISSGSTSQRINLLKRPVCWLLCHRIFFFCPHSNQSPDYVSGPLSVASIQVLVTDFHCSKRTSWNAGCELFYRTFILNCHEWVQSFVRVRRQCPSQVFREPSVQRVFLFDPLVFTSHTSGMSNAYLTTSHRQISSNSQQFNAAV